jgi:hypothetical protein
MFTLLLMMQATAGDVPANPPARAAPVQPAYNVCAVPPVAPFSDTQAAIRQAWITAKAVAQARRDNAQTDEQIAAAQTQLDIAKACADTGQYNPPETEKPAAKPA